jgi:hypothetical protein
MLLIHFAFFLGMLHQHSPCEHEQPKAKNYHMVERIKNAYIIVLRFVFGVLFAVMGRFASDFHQKNGY